jgi:DNA helicase HerA-like ATPase
VPGVVDRTLIRPPTSRIGPITPDERAAIRSRSPVGSRYDTPLDRESAAEVLQRRAEQAAAAAERQAPPKDAPARRSSTRQTPTEAAVKSFLRSVSSTLGREILRGILGAIKKR